MSERKNAGYTIVESIHIGNTEFVIGHKPGAPSQYVTWECTNGDNYFWGHYMDERHQAERDLLERASSELDLQERARTTHKNKDKEKER